MAGGSTGGGGVSVAGGDASKRGTSAIGDVARMLASNYRDNTPKRLQVLDMFLVFLFLTGAVQVTKPQTRHVSVDAGSFDRSILRSLESTAFLSPAATVRRALDRITSFFRGHKMAADQHARVHLRTVPSLPRQFAYCMLVGTFPFNSFLAGFMCALGVFVLTGV